MTEVVVVGMIVAEKVRLNEVGVAVDSYILRASKAIVISGYTR